VVLKKIFGLERGRTMSAGELAEHLNRNHLPTGSGQQYAGARGMFTMFKSLYDHLAA
jgi:hypothetical protein